MKYVGKQKALALAVMAMLASGTAQAVDLSVSPVTGTISYAKESKFDDTSTPSFTQATTEFNIVAPLKTGVSATDYYLRFQLSAGEWTNGTDLLNTVITGATTTVLGTGGVGTTPLSASAAYLSADKTGFILPVTFQTNGQPTDTVSVNFAAGKVIVRSTAAKKIPTGGTVAVTMSVFGGGSAGQLAANNNDATQALGTSTGNYMTFDTSIFSFVETDQSTNTAVINVLNESKSFVVGSNASTTKTVKLCEIDIKESAALLTTGGTADATAANEAASTASTLVAAGDFSAVADSGSFTTATALGRVYLKQGTGCLAADAVAIETATEELPKTLTATSATFEIGNNNLSDFVDDSQPAAGAGSAAGVHSLCMTVNGTTPISTTPVTLTYKPVATATYTVADKAFSKCVPFTKNGSTASVPMLLNPSSAVPSYIRVTNPSGQPGNVNIYSIDDDGKRSTTALTFMLGAGKSSGLISPQAIIDATGVGPLAAGTKTVAVAGQANKLRLYVEAEFGAGHNGLDITTGAPSQSAVIVRTYAVSSDATGFSEFQ